jgi:hypothetical protein
MTFITEAEFKRQAQIISKEFDIPHSRALEVASKLNGFKNYHQAQQELEEPAPPTEAENAERAKQEREMYKFMGVTPYKMKVKALAEVKFYRTIFAKNKEEAFAKLREEITSEVAPEDWEVSYLHEDLGFKITDVQNELDPKDYVQNDTQGVEQTPVNWPL